MNIFFIVESRPLNFIALIHDEKKIWKREIELFIY